MTEPDPIATTRDFDHPPAILFRMWTDAEKLARWWGPAGCIVTQAEMDPRPGGTMRVDQRFPDGEVRRMNAIFEEVAPPELLILRIASPGEAGFSPWTAVHTVTFEELAPGRTRLTAVTRVIAGPDVEREDLAAAYREGWGESLEKLRDALEG